MRTRDTAGPTGGYIHTKRIPPDTNATRHRRIAVPPHPPRSTSNPPSTHLSTPRLRHTTCLLPNELTPPGPSRCFPFWQEVLACYVTNTSPESPEGKIKCQPVLEDYYECLHHKKEVRFSLSISPLNLPAIFYSIQASRVPFTYFDSIYTHIQRCVS